MKKVKKGSNIDEKDILKLMKQVEIHELTRESLIKNIIKDSYTSISNEKTLRFPSQIKLKKPFPLKNSGKGIK